jgi:3-phosphoshikimate 1-carboxyvinyltransferase
MKVSISRSEVKGQVTAPPSKSYTIRSVVCSLLAHGESTIVHPLFSDDTLAALDVSQKIGAVIERQQDKWLIQGGNFNNGRQELFCGDSAATLRFMTAICSVIPGKWILTAGHSLSRRPIKPLVEALNQLGIDCSSQEEFPPVNVIGGEVRGGTVRLPGDISSQYISALMLMAPLTSQGLTIELTTPPESVPYIMMTRDCMRKYGIKVNISQNIRKIVVAKQAYTPIRFVVEGDWSSASYFLALGAMAGEVGIKNLNMRSLQADRKILELMKKMGAVIRYDKDILSVSRSKLNAVNADLSDCIDLLPTVAVLAAAAKGTSRLSGIRRGRIKESDRVAAVTEGLRNTGIKVQEDEDLLTITGSIPKGTIIDSRDDHRIAMAFSLLGSITGDTEITRAECVSKTFPDYWDILKSIGVKVEING